MDGRYRETKGASPIQGLREQALIRAKLARARVSNRPSEGDDHSYSTGVGGTVDFMSSVRAADRAERNQAFEQEGSGVFGGKASSLSARKDARLGQGKKDLYA